MNFQYNYSLSGSNRKPLIDAISQILGQPAVYQGAPSFAYRIDGYMVDKNGILSSNDDTGPEAVKMLVEALHEHGFVATAGETKPEEPNDAENNPYEGNAEETTTAENTADSESLDKFTIKMPDTGFTPETRANLRKIVASKATLLKQALGTNDLAIIEHDGEIAFPWFTLHGLDGEADAYSRLVTAICKMAKTQKRVTATEKPEENAKYGMRLFLVRLGFIGDEYKTARKILLRNLTGNGSWKSGHQPERPTEDAEADNTEKL